MSNSHYYFKFSDTINDRLDDNYNDPYYDKIDGLLEKAKFKVTRLGNREYLLGITSGKTPTGIHYLEEGGVPFLGASSIINEQVLIEDAPRIRTELHEGVLKGSQILRDNVLLTMAGTIGRCAVYRRDEDCNCNQAVAVLQLNEENIVPDFLAEYLNSNIGQLFFGKLQHISSQPNINTTEIGKIKLILPTKDEQGRILEPVVKTKSVLSSIETEIAQLKDKKNDVVLDSFGLLDWKDKMGTYFFREGKSLKSLYFALDFGELEDRTSYLFYDPRLKLLKKFMEEYSTTTLKEAVTKSIVRGIQPEYVGENGVTVIKTVDLNDGYIDYENCLKTSQDSFESSPDAHIEQNDVLVASTGYVSIGKVDVHDLEEEAIVDGHVSILRLKQEYDPQFIASFLRSHLGKIQFEKWWSGSSGQIELQPSDLEKFVIPESGKDGIPLSEQENISKQINELSSKIEELRQKHNQTRKEAQNLFETALYK